MKTFKLFGIVLFFLLFSCSFVFSQWNQSSPNASQDINRPGTISLGNLFNPGQAKFLVDHDSDQIFNVLIHNPRGAARLLRLKGGWPGGTQNIFQVEGNQLSGNNYVEGNHIFVIQPNKRVGILIDDPQETLHMEGGNFLISDGGGINRFTVRANGFTGILTDNPQEALHIQGGNFLLSDASGVNQFRVNTNGFVRARQIDVDLDPIPDYVFEPDYDLMTLDHLKSYIQEHKHLPGIKSAKEYEEVGSINLSELNLQLLEKVEELTLYILELREEVQTMKQQLDPNMQEK